MDSESNESVNRKFVMPFKSEGMNCGVVEVVKHSTLRERLGRDELTKRIYKSGVDMSYLRGACGLNRMDGENNESVYGKSGVSS